jgi:hypothetical protein
VVVITQMIAYLWRAVAIAIVDAPDYFLRVEVISILTPIAVLVIMFAFKLDKRLAQLDSGIFFILMAGIVTISTMVIAILEVIYFYDVPADLITPSGRTGRVISPISLTLYIVALILTTIYSVRALRTSKDPPNPEIPTEG